MARLLATCPQAELRDRAKALAYARKGCGVPDKSEEGEFEINTRRFAMPMKAHCDVKEMAKVRLFVSSDRGKTWKHEKDYLPSVTRAVFLAPDDGPYWFALQLVLKDGSSEPAKEDELLPAMKVYVNSTERMLKSPLPCREPQDEAAQLGKTVNQLQKKNKELQADCQPK